MLSIAGNISYMSFHFMSCVCHVTSLEVMSRHVLSCMICHFVPRQVMSCHARYVILYVLPCHVMRF